MDYISSRATLEAMNGHFQLSIRSPTGAPGLVLEFSDLSVESVRGGMKLLHKRSGKTAVLRDDELQAVVCVGGGPTPLSALLIRYLLEQKFGPES